MKGVRASIGTLIKAGLASGRLDEEPTTAYLLLDGKCSGNCTFCPLKSGSEFLSRVRWPKVGLNSLLLIKGFERYCIQGILKGRFWEEVIEVAKSLDGPVSVSINPVSRDKLEKVYEVSDKLGVGLDAMSPRIFRQVRKPGSWKSYLKFVEWGVAVYGKGNVLVHLIAGLGETLKEALFTMRLAYRMGAGVALFAYTPINPRRGKGPDKGYYRYLQAYRYFLHMGWNPLRIPKEDPDSYKEAFLTSGCPGCNRPFYNERPVDSTLYNYPSMDRLNKDWEKVREELIGFINSRVLPKEEVR